MARASGLTIEVERCAIPVHPALREWAQQLNLDPVQVSLTGGEAYELVFTAAADGAGTLLADFLDTFPNLLAARVGRCTAGAARVLVDGREAAHGGFDHFG